MAIMLIRIGLMSMRCVTFFLTSSSIGRVGENWDVKRHKSNCNQGKTNQNL